MRRSGTGKGRAGKEHDATTVVDDVSDVVSEPDGSSEGGLALPARKPAEEFDTREERDAWAVNGPAKLLNTD